MGWRNRSVETPAWTAQCVVRVGIVERRPHGKYSRRLENLLEVVGQCNGSTLDNGARLECVVVRNDLTMAAKVDLLQTLQIMVTPWGGDTINALHMRRGAAVLELVHHEFARYGPRSSVEILKRWVTRSRKKAGRLLYDRLTVNGTVYSREVRKCLRELVDPKRQGGRAPTKDRWICFWNADLHVEWLALRRALVHVIARAGSYAHDADTSRRPMPACRPASQPGLSGHPPTIHE